MIDNKYHHIHMRVCRLWYHIISHKRLISGLIVKKQQTPISVAVKSLSLLKWSYQNGLPLNKNLCPLAAEEGNLDILIELYY